MKTRIQVTWPPLTGDYIAKLYGITPERREELRRIGTAARERVLAQRKADAAAARKLKAERV